MQPIHRFYVDHMSAQYGYRATWEPNKKLFVGAIIRLEKGVFSLQSSLEKEGIPMEVVESSNKGILDYSSNGSVNIATKLAGKSPLAGSVLTEAEAGFNITFATDKAIVFQAEGTSTTQISNLGAIGKEVISRMKNDQWDKDWLIVAELMSASTATIIISYSGNSNIDLKANAAVEAAQLKLTNAELGLSVASEQGEHVKVLAGEGITPLYRVMGIRHPLFGKHQLGVRDLKNPGSPPTPPNERFQIQPFDPDELEE